MSQSYSISPSIARRMSIACQRLAGPRPTANREGLMEIARALRCLQLDPINVVARSHLLVLWSRLGQYDLAELERLLWEERRLFEYWAHCASIVLTEDYPIHQLRMRRYAKGNSVGARRMREWAQANAPLRDYILSKLRAEGPLASRQFEDRATVPWQSSGWYSGRSVGRMLDFLWGEGTVMVAGRSGQQKLWDLAERCLPDWTPRTLLEEREVVRRAAQEALRALGVATPAHLQEHFIRGRYPELENILAELEAEGRVVPVEIQAAGATWPGRWYIHVEDLPLLDRLSAGEWEPRTTLLSPFDNLICDRARTEQLWNFHYRMEIYVPREKRRYGYYVLPILQGERFVARADLKMDRKVGRLIVQALHAEADAIDSSVSVREIRGALEGLATFLGASKIQYERVPVAWRTELD